MTNYGVVFEPADDGSWSAYSIDIPGVFAIGADRPLPSQHQRGTRVAPG